MKKVAIIVCFFMILMFTASCALASSEAVNNTPVPTDAEAVRNIISVIGQTSDFFGFGAMIQIIFENGVTVGSDFFES